VLNHYLTAREDPSCMLAPIFHEARAARREKWWATGHPWPVTLSPTARVRPCMRTHTVGSTFRRCDSEAIHKSRGHILLEALMGCALALSASAALWQLASSAQHLAARADTRTTPHCVAPECQRSSVGYVCACAHDSFSLVE
jgi:hypothetical protein